MNFAFVENAFLFVEYVIKKSALKTEHTFFT